MATAGLAHADSAAAERLFREGIRLRDDGDFAAACPKFADSFAQDPAPGTLVNLGDCEVRIGKLMAAIEHYKLAVSGFPKGDKRRELVAQKATAVEPKLAHLTVRVAPTVPDNARITRGGAPFERNSGGVAITVDPGKITLVVSANARQDATYDVELAEGQSKEVVVDIGAPAVVSAPATPRGPASDRPTPDRPASDKASSATSGSARPLRTAGFIVGGVGIVGLGVGAVTGILATAKASTVRDHCDTTTYVCDSQGVDAAHSGNTFATVSTVTLIAGGALLAGGAAMIYLGGKKKESSVAIVPAFGPAGGSATLVGRF
jgi:hypothetical protein